MNKKGVSEMIGYVLLVVIAVSISVLVYFYLRPLIFNPDAVPQCTQDVNLIATESSCVIDAVNDKKATVSFTLSNKGLWSISAAHVKMGKQGDKIKKISLLPGTPFPDGDLVPGEIKEFSVPTKEQTSSFDETFDYEIEIEPVQKLESGEEAVCSNSIITLPVRCTMGA